MVQHSSRGEANNKAIDYCPTGRIKQLSVGSNSLSVIGGGNQVNTTVIYKVCDCSN